jgi:RHS repeat-associated protein
MKAQGSLHRAIASAAVLFTSFAGCGVSRPTSLARWETVRVRYVHHGVSAGPVLLTRADASLEEERRYEPFGADLDAYREDDDGIGLPIGEVDLTTFDLNSLNKRTEPATGWSYHGARWMSGATARWQSADPPAKRPDPSFLARPWHLHPYQYVLQNPISFWDSDGRDADMVSLGKLSDVKGSDQYVPGSFMPFTPEGTMLDRTGADGVTYRPVGMVVRKSTGTPVMLYGQVDNQSYVFERDIEDHGEDVPYIESKPNGGGIFPITEGEAASFEGLDLIGMVFGGLIKAPAKLLGRMQSAGGKMFNRVSIHIRAEMSEVALRLKRAIPDGAPAALRNEVASFLRRTRKGIQGSTDVRHQTWYGQARAVNDNVAATSGRLRQAAAGIEDPKVKAMYENLATAAENELKRLAPLNEAATYADEAASMMQSGGLGAEKVHAHTHSRTLPSGWDE